MFKLLCKMLILIVSTQSLTAATTYSTSSASFVNWDSGWILPETGKGVVSFTVTPARGESLHDIAVMFSSVEGVAGQDSNGGSDADNLLTCIANWNNTESVVNNGWSSVQTYYYWFTGDRMIQGAGYFVGSETLILANATADAAYDIRITLDEPNNIFHVEARPSGVGDFIFLYSYTGATFPVPTNSQYFSFASNGNQLDFSDIAVSAAPTVDPTTIFIDSFPAYGDPFFTTWRSDWQLPATGQGVVSFTVTPTLSQSLSDVTIGFSSVRGIAGSSAGGIDADNFWTVIGGWTNTECVVRRGIETISNYYYLINSTYGTVDASPAYNYSIVPFLQDASARISYDFRITLDQPRNFMKVEGRVAGVGNYHMLYVYGGNAFAVPQGLQYFSFGNYAYPLFFSNISVSALPASGGITLDGRSSIKYLSTEYTFTDGECALGYVYFSKGFSVPAGQQAYLDIIPPVGGAINLNGTGTLVLHSPLRLDSSSTGFVSGGNVKTSDGSEGLIVFNNNTVLPEPLTFENSMLLDFEGNQFTFSSTGTDRGCLMIDNVVSQTVTLRNGKIIGVEDFATGFGPKLRGSAITSGRHGYACSNTDLYLTTEGTMTMTGVDLVCAAGFNNMYCPYSGQVMLHDGLYINDSAALHVNEGLTLALNTNLTSSYFSIGHGSSLLLNNATFAYNKSLAFPSPYLPKDMVSSLIIQGASALQALGAGDDCRILFGGSTNYDYDPFIDVYPGGVLSLDNVVVVNNNTLR